MTKSSYDVAVIGAGPTGLAAALYTAREDLRTVVLDKGVAGGLIATTEWVDNYPGFAKGIGGIELADQMKQQAERFGATVSTMTEVAGFAKAEDGFRVKTGGGEIVTKTILVATGSSYRHLNIPGESELEGRGVHYCATCDGPLYRGRELLVVGGGNTALQETLFLAKFAKKITMLVRGSEFRGSEILVDEIGKRDNVEVRFNTQITELKLEGNKFSQAIVQSPEGSASLKADGVFVFIGLIPNTGWLPSEIQLDDRKFVTVDAHFNTSVPGVFAAGDVVEGSIGQVASAVGEGVSAALAIRGYLDPAHASIQ